MTILWLIERLLVKPTEGSNTDVVITADWRCNGSQESFSGTCYGSCSFAPPTGSFTPYDQLTEAQVLDWCYANGVDQAAIEANVSLQIQNQINPPVKLYAAGADRVVDSVEALRFMLDARFPPPGVV